MDQAAAQTGQVVQKMIDQPTDAWMALLPILFILLLVYVMWQNERREGRYHGTLNGALCKISDTLESVDGNLTRLNEKVDNMEGRVEDIEDHIGIKGGVA